MSDENVIIGIDLGTTNSGVGVIDTGFPVLIPGENGKRLTPSIVSYGKPKEPPVAGETAKRMSAQFPKSTIYSAKRLIGRRFNELSPEEVEDLAYSVVPGEEGWAGIQIHDSVQSPEAVSSHILSKLKNDAEAYLNRKVDRAVISVPAYFNEGQRQKTKWAATQAGLSVERIISEPTAAALAYGIDREHKKAKIAVYDLGGGTFDVSILELTEGVFEVLATSGNTRLGGDDIDQQLSQWIRRQIEENDGELPSSPEIEHRLREAAESAKIELSEKEDVEIQLPFITPEISWSGVCLRSQLAELARPIIEQTRTHCLRALQDAGLTLSDLDEVLLVGGQTRMPLVREYVGDVFGKTPNTSMDPDEAVARGATIQAGILSGALNQMVLLDVTPLSLGIETFGGLMNVIIPRNSTIPCKAGELFTTAVDFQEAMAVTILQGERELAQDNWKLGRMDIAFRKVKRGEARVGVQFEIDSDGLLHVLARDVETGHEERVQVESAVDVSDEDVEEMVAESVEHAFSDMEERRKIEAKGKAERLLATAETALKQAGEALSAETRTQIDEAMESLKSKVSEGTSKEIKAAMEALDQASLPLADALVEQAMEQAALKVLGQ
ncbi:MAG: molecular chaperone DnaK [Verrucomicrobiota bacterium]